MLSERCLGEIMVKGKTVQQASVILTQWPCINVEISRLISRSLVSHSGQLHFSHMHRSLVPLHLHFSHLDIREMLASSSRNAPIDKTDPHEDSTNSNNEDTDANYISNRIF